MHRLKIQEISNDQIRVTLPEHQTAEQRAQIEKVLRDTHGEMYMRTHIPKGEYNFPKNQLNYIIELDEQIYGPKGDPSDTLIILQAQAAAASLRVFLDELNQEEADKVIDSLKS